MRAAARRSGRTLNDVQIIKAILDGHIIVTPLIDPEQVGSNTLDLRLGTHFILKKMERLPHLDPAHFHQLHEHAPERVLSLYTAVKTLSPIESFVLHPGQLVLGCSLEYVKLPPNIGADLDGRSTWAREGLHVHSTAGDIHPGHEGIIVFELGNFGGVPLELYPGVRVAQLKFYEMTSDSYRPYNEMESAKFLKYVATNYGRPWQDWEFGKILEAKERAKRLAENRVPTEVEERVKAVVADESPTS